MRQVFAADGPGELRLAVLDEGGLLIAAELHRAGAPDRIGEVHQARLARSAPGGWFVQLADAEAFLPANEVPRRQALVEGAAVAVRVTRAAQGGKGLRVAIKGVAEVPAAGGPKLIAAAPDPVLRLACEHQAPASRAMVFPDHVEEAFAVLLEPVAALPGGGRVSIHPTAAATLLDVDAGAGAPAEANRRAAPELARQIVARNLSGVILIDFAALDGAAAKRGMAEAMRAALAVDPLQAQVTGYSPAGLIELVRRKVRPPLHEQVWDWPLRPRPSVVTLALSALRRALAEALADPALRPALRAHPTVVAALAAQPAALADFRARAGADLALAADPAIAPGAERTEDARVAR